MNNFLSMFSSMFQNGSPSTGPNISSNANTPNQQTSNNIQSPSSDYPEVFFTNPKFQTQSVQTQSNTNPNVSNNSPSFTNQNQQGVNSSSNLSELLKAFLPFLNKNNNKPDLNALFKNINPNFSNILSLLSSQSGKNKNKKEAEETTSTNNKIIDLSAYTKTN